MRTRIVIIIALLPLALGLVFVYKATTEGKKSADFVKIQQVEKVVFTSHEDGKATFETSGGAKCSADYEINRKVVFSNEVCDRDASIKLGSYNAVFKVNGNLQAISIAVLFLGAAVTALSARLLIEDRNQMCEFYMVSVLVPGFLLFCFLVFPSIVAGHSRPQEMTRYEINYSEFKIRNDAEVVGFENGILTARRGDETCRVWVDPYVRSDLAAVNGTDCSFPINPTVVVVR